MEGEKQTKHKGKVVEFKSRNGFGFVQPEDSDVGDKLFVHWKEIQTDDQWPCLKAGMDVEFQVKEANGKKQCVNVTAVGGDKVHVGDDDTKKYDMSTKYSGKVKFFDTKKGFGFITPDPDNEIEWEGKTVKKEEGIYVPREEIYTDDEPPAMNEGCHVEFNVYSGERGLGAGKVAMVGGGKIEYKPENDRKRRRVYTPNRRRMPPMMPGGNDNLIEAGIHVENKYVGGLIGKGGEVAKQLRSDTGARIQFGDSRLGQGPNAKRVLSIIGDEEQVTKACIAVGSKIAEIAENGDQQKLVFLVPDAYCGMFIGKGGSFLKQIREKEIKIHVSDQPVALPAASMVSTASVFGPAEKIAEAVKLIVPKLGQISRRVRQDQLAMQFPWGLGQVPPIPLRQKW